MILGFFAVLLTLASFSAVQADDTVKVFILAGQSNMEGKAQQILLDHQADKLGRYRKDDEWAVRDDVFIKFLNRHGGLTVGYGSPGRTGVELEFGTAMGEHFEEPVLLIKTAWGGRSLYKPFRPPSAGLPADEKLKEELENAQNRVKNSNEKNNRDEPLPTMEDIKAGYGADYRNMMTEIDETFKNYEELFPQFKGKKLELCGFVWFQGWNDQYGGAELEYEANMKHFINDVRKDLDAPKLPFVIGAMGQNGSKEPQGAMLTIQNAQMAMMDVPEFKDNVKTIRTDVLVDKAAEELYPTWKDNFEKWQQTGSDHGYHYLGSIIWYNRIGAGFADSMLELMGEKK